MKEPTHTPTEDVYEALKDGNGRVLVARAGKPMTWERALMLGLVEGDPPVEKGKATTDAPRDR